MIRGRVIIVASSLLGIVACDKVYHARVDVGPYGSAQTTVTPLTPGERDQAVAMFQTTASELGLRCKAEKYPIIIHSYDPLKYRLTSCWSETDLTQVQLADSATHVSVEVYKVAGGIGEPSVFKTCRTRFAAALGGALPRDKVTVRYPYRRGREGEREASAEAVQQ
jgi:hypothetical protein